MEDTGIHSKLQSELSEISNSNKCAQHRMDQPQPPPSTATTRPSNHHHRHHHHHHHQHHQHHHLLYCRQRQRGDNNNNKNNRQDDSDDGDGQRDSKEGGDREGTTKVRPPSLPLSLLLT